MSNWGRKVSDALKSSQIRQGIAQIAVAWMEAHIAENRGQPRSGAVDASGGGPDGMPHKPLKMLKGHAWKSSKPRSGASRTRTVSYTDKSGKKRTRKEYLVETEGYRNGGQPLRNTGQLANSLNANGQSLSSGLRIVLRGAKYGLFQDMGFHTKGPNFIPLTKAASRYSNSASARAAGLSSGADFIGTKRGVTVPARPFLLPTKNDMKDIGVSIRMGLHSILKGK